MGHQQTLVSVIITCYNYAEFVEEAINSVLCQTHKTIEIIIIDDGSTDNSLEIINKYNDKARVISRANKGIVYTRNEGLEVANGEYICFLDADDYFNKDYIEKSLRVAIEYDADVVYPHWRVFGEQEYYTYYPEFNLQSLIKQEIHCTSESLIRSNAVKGHIFESERVAEDWDFFLGMALAGKKFKLAGDNFINYRVRKNTRGSSRPYWDDMYYYCEILQKWQKKYPTEVNPFDLPIARGKWKDEYAQQLAKENREKEESIQEKDHSIELMHNEIIQIRQSRSYRVGQVISRPLSMIKKLIK